VSDDRRPGVAGATIVVTGASSGIGRGAAVRLAGLGANVVVAARRGEVLDELVEQITAAGGNAVSVVTDVSEPEQVSLLADTAALRFGSIDVWINNVGIGALGVFWEVPVADHARVLEVNLTGLVYGAHAALRRFVAQGHGVLVNVGSVESEVPLALQASYAASKAGVLSLGRTLEEELRLVGLSDGIAVSTVMPWAVDTPWWDHAANYTDHAPRMAAMDDTSVVVDAIVAACTSPSGHRTVGTKARVSELSHRLLPDITERLSAKLSAAEVRRGHRVPHTTGAIYAPVPEGTTVDGATRERMRAEDARSTGSGGDAG